MSVAEITSRDTYINNKPVLGGLFDPRMGVIEDYLRCPTDDQTDQVCPGYFGKIKLAKPVFNYIYMNYIEKILKCFCFRCSNKTKNHICMLSKSCPNFCSIY